MNGSAVYIACLRTWSQNDNFKIAWACAYLERVIIRIFIGIISLRTLGEKKKKKEEKSQNIHDQNANVVVDGSLTVYTMLL